MRNDPVFRKDLDMKRKRDGFTIIELLAVAMIIALLAVFVVPRAFRGLGKARRWPSSSMTADGCRRRPRDWRRW
jgi:prepilin-type N-terminal cleavage/methylation domain-containing protein